MPCRGQSTSAGAAAETVLIAVACRLVRGGTPPRYAAARWAPARHARHGPRDEADGPGYRTCRGRTGGCRMTSQGKSSRDRHQPKPIDAEPCGDGCPRNHLLYRLAPAEIRWGRSAKCEK